jgi:hypothetical protein
MITVHVYTMRGVKEKKFGDREHEKAIEYAEKKFKRHYVYKVKVWSGKPIPNLVNAPGLLLELV